MPTVCPACKRLAARDRSTRWTANNPARAREVQRAWRERNPEAMKAARAEWKRNNPERVREYRREVKRRNPMANRSYVRARTARRKGLTVVPVSSAGIAERMAYFGGRCWMCGSGDQITLDHVKPLSRGGAHALSNLRPACHDCNTRKGASWPFPTSPSSFPGWEAILTAKQRGLGSAAG